MVALPFDLHLEWKAINLVASGIKLNIMELPTSIITFFPDHLGGLNARNNKKIKIVFFSRRMRIQRLLLGQGTI